MYEVIRDVTPTECHWLGSTVPAGSIVYAFEGTTYGCVGDGGTAFTFDGTDRLAGHFFELPNDSVMRLE